MKKMPILVFLIVAGSLFISSCEKKKESGLPMDGDGNEYDTLAIGTQVWLNKNLKTTKFRDGSPIRLVTDDMEWTQTSLPVYCWYKNDPATYKDTYGALYNWYAGRLEMLCPLGYHVPTKDEWIALANYIKDAPVTVKQSFGVQPLGWRVWNGSFDQGLIGCWWSSSTDSGSPNVRQDFSFGAMPKNTGYSVRCIKNN
jgi:hypothetical protein